METKHYIENFIESSIFSHEFNDFDQIQSLISKRLSKKNELKIVYGETYDEFGLTIDSLKYYFTLDILGKLLRSNGMDVKAILIIGDVASTRNKAAVNKKVSIDSRIKENLSKIRKIIGAYNLDIQVRLMSELFESNKYKQNFENVTSICLESDQIKQILENTVLQNRIKQERESEFLYSREEIALITDYNIKIGPPRELNYDNVARIISRRLGLPELISLYLEPTYPLGLNFDYFISNPQIEKYGITPYKGGSNKLNDHRLFLENLDKKNIENLLDKSSVPSDPTLPNPVGDIYIIADLARRMLENDFEFVPHPTTQIDTKVILNLFDKYVIQIL
ncbi:hypothetical protein GF389_03630 [Candidatus Dojkabacteria bacterium]|nr:hypothetical protein [Candidatus Dojkabacteria bacterium]